MSIELQAQATRDRYAALLRDALRVLSPETVSNWLAQLEGDLNDPDINSADKLEVNAMLVGVLSVMLEGIDAAKGNT